MSTSIQHVEDLKPSDFLRFLEAYSCGRLEASEKLDGSACMELGVDGGRLWTRSKHGARRHSSAEHPDVLAHRALRAAHAALERAGAGFVEGWPECVKSIRAEVLHTAVPNVIEYGPDAIVVHGIDMHDCTHDPGSMIMRIVRSMGKLPGWVLAIKPLVDYDRDALRDEAAIMRDLKRDFFSHPVEKAGLDEQMWFSMAKSSAKTKLLRLVKATGSAFGGGEIEGIVFLDPGTGAMTKVVDRDGFTRRNKLMWRFRELLDQGTRVGEKWVPGVFRKFRDAVADDVLGIPAIKSPILGKKIAEAGGIERYVALFSGGSQDVVAALDRVLRDCFDDLIGLRKSWAADGGRGMHPIVKQRTDGAFAETAERFMRLRDELETIGGLPSDVAKRAAILRMAMGQNRLEKLREAGTFGPAPGENGIDLAKAQTLISKHRDSMEKRGVRAGRDMPFIGAGAHGCAFGLSPGLVLKITDDQTEARASFALVGQRLKHAALIYDVFRFPLSSAHNGRPVYGIVVEKVKLLPKDRAHQIDLAAGTMIRLFDPEWEHVPWEELKHRVATGDFDTGDASAKQDEIIRLQRAISILEDIQTPEILDELRHHGIEWGDVHGDNIGMRGKAYVAFDLGRSKSAGRTPPELEEAMRRRRARLTERVADTVGVTIGRYQPFHKGHAEIVRKLAKDFTKVIVIVAGNKRDERNPFSLETRMEMIRKSLPDVISKIEIHPIEGTGYVPRILSDLASRPGSSVKPGIAVTVMVGRDRFSDMQQQFARARQNATSYGLGFDPSQSVVQTLPDVLNDDDAGRISGSAIRRAIRQNDKGAFGRMVDPHLASNEADLVGIYKRLHDEAGDGDTVPIVKEVNGIGGIYSVPADTSFLAGGRKAKPDEGEDEDDDHIRGSSNIVDDKSPSRIQ